MTRSIDGLVQKISDLQEQLEEAFEERRAEYAYRIDRRRVVFEREVMARHRELKIRFWAYVKDVRPIVILTAPFIYAVIIPFVLLDLFATIYQAVCFPVYGIAKARRQDFIRFDRTQLGYLNGIEKLNCAYCSYANGLIAYVREIASRTEQYWCPIKHAERVAGVHDRYPGFLEYGDAEGYLRRLQELRELLQAEAGKGQEKTP